MSFWKHVFKPRTVEGKIKAGLAQAEQELYDARIAMHNASHHISYWESRIALLKGLEAPQKAADWPPTQAPAEPMTNS